MKQNEDAADEESDDGSEAESLDSDEEREMEIP